MRVHSWRFVRTVLVTAVAGLAGAWMCLAAPPVGLPIPRPAAPFARPVVAPAAEPVAKAGGTNGTSEAGPYVLEFENAPLEMILDEYAETVQRTLLLAPGLPKASIVLKSDIELTKDEYVEAMETVLSLNGVALLKEGEKFVRVVPNKTARQEPMAVREPGSEGKISETSAMVSQVIQLRHVEVAEAQKLIDPLKHPYGTVQIFERNNSLLLTDSANTVNRILQVIALVDVPAEAREETIIKPIRYAKAADIKRRIEEIIAESQEEQKKSAVARPRDSGQPGVVPRSTTASTVPSLPGIIRARPTTPESTGVDAAAADLGDAGAAEAERGIIRGKVKIVADDRTNQLILITRPENMKFFDRIIEVLDVATAPDVVVRVFRLEFSDAKTVAGMLNDLIGAASTGKDDATATTTTTTGTTGSSTTTAASSAATAARDAAARAISVAARTSGSKIGELSKDNIKILSDERTNALVIMASEGDLATLTKIIQDMDTMLSQVLIESVILEIELNDQFSTGVDWVQRAMVGYGGNSSDGSAKVAFAGGGGGGQTSPKSALDLTTTSSLTGLGSGLSYYMTFFDLNVDAVVKMAASDKRSKVISTPVILTTDNKEAKLTSTEKIYVLESVTYRSSTDGSDYNNYSKADVGLELTVKPRINKNRVVMMEVQQTMSEPTATSGVSVDNLAGTSAYKERKITAAIAVRSGQTIVLGGMVRETKTNDKDKVPFLGDIPLLGRLFSYKNDASKRTETVVFLTPFVMDTPEEISTETRRRKDALSAEGVWRQGWSGSKLADPVKAGTPRRAKSPSSKAADDAMNDVDMPAVQQPQPQP